MTVPRTYQDRLIGYVAVMLVFIVGVLFFTYQSSSALVLREAETGLERVATQLKGQILADSSDLSERARMVRDNSSLQEYMFIATSLGTDPLALRERYRRDFGWLHVNRAVVLSKNDRVYVGEEHRNLVQALIDRELTGSPISKLFYQDGPQGLEMVTTAPIHYRSQHLGVVALTKILDAEWMAAVRQITGGELFFVRDGKISMSTLGAKAIGKPFALAESRIAIDEDTYIVHKLKFCEDSDTCQFYLALSQTDLMARISTQRNLVMTFAVVGGLSVLIIGLMILRNFGAPVSRLAAMIGEVSQGRFPDFPRATSNDEIGFLWNKFTEMVHNLRDKQHELTTVHEQLEKQAVTDVLTGLYNRRYLYDIYPKLRSESIRQNKYLSMILIDLDHFKSVNDRHGHLVGDKVLVHLANVLRESCRVSDFLFRLGGEEFLVLTHTDVDGAQIQAEKIRSRLEHSHITEGETTILVTASLGVDEAQDSDGVNGLTQALARVDKALYVAKQAGRNRVACLQSPKLVVSNR